MNKKKLLIIGKDVVSAKNTAKILRNLGYPVTALAAVDAKALPRVKKIGPHLVLIDGQLAYKGARTEIARKINEELEIPVLVLIERSEMRLLEPALKKLSYGCLLKPIDKHNMEIAVETALARRSLEKKNKYRFDQALRESEERYHQLVDNISEGIVIQNKNGIITFANERFLGMIGYRRREVLGCPVTKFLGKGRLKKEDAPRAGKEGRRKSVEFTWKRKDRKRICAILSRKPIYDASGRFKGSVSVLTDVTDQREVEVELRRSQEELRSLSRHIQSVREIESKRIAGEIHDVLGQQLTALKIDLSWLASRVAPLGESGKEIQTRIGAMSELADKTIQSVQKISAELRPVLLDDLGLGPAIDWLAQDFENRTKIQCRVHLGCDDISLDADRSTAIFRISQEALTNVVRHARATSVDINLSEQAGALVLKISDNGRGIKENEIGSPSSLGFMGMRERIRPFDGKLEIAGSPDRGTELTVALPLKKGMMRKPSG